MLHDPIERLTDDQLEDVLESALSADEAKLIQQVIHELDRRGGSLEL